MNENSSMEQENASNAVNASNDYRKPLKSGSPASNRRIYIVMCGCILAAAILFAGIYLVLSGLTQKLSTANPVTAAEQTPAAAENETEIAEPALENEENEAAENSQYSYTNGLWMEKLAKYEAACEVVRTDSENIVYQCSAKGFEAVNEAMITVDGTKQAIVSIEVTKMADTAGVGSEACEQEELDRYIGASLSTPIDETSGATITSTSIHAMAAAALKNAADR